MPLTVVTLNKNGTVNVPTNFAVPAWYSGARSPGQKGSAVILGHVDNYHGPAVFFHLDKLQLGNRVDVTLADELAGLPALHPVLSPNVTSNSEPA